MPLLTEGAIEHLITLLDRGDMRVLEFGSGYSTLWLANRCQLTSVEHDRSWFHAISDRMTKQFEYLRADRPYSHIAERYPDHEFDVVIVDGRDRARCVASSMPKVKPGGIIMVDNMERVERYAEIPRLLSGWQRTDAFQENFPDAWVFRGPKDWLTSWWSKPC